MKIYTYGGKADKPLNKTRAQKLNRIMKYKDKKIGIWGTGKEGQALLKYFLSLDAPIDLCLLSDIADTAPLPKDIPYFYGTEAMDKISSGFFDIIFKSPGISLYRPEVISAKENSTLFSSATNLWFENNTDTKTIIVTGTKGKSTTASLLHSVMKLAGLPVTLAGNIGIPALDITEETEYTILELSSYQLADLHHVPNYYIILNLFPEHLQWHQTHENYYSDKLAPLKHADQDCTIIANIENQALKKRLDDLTKDICWFNTPDGYHVTDNTLYIGQKILPLKIALKGHHNLENVAAVLTLCQQLGMNTEKCLSDMAEFTPLAHRLQEFTSASGLTCVNDSISTTPETTLAAMKVYGDHPLILMLGGTDRGQNYKHLIQEMPKFDIRGIALLPENGTRVKTELEAMNLNIPLYMAAHLADATQFAKSAAKTGDIVLLSPGAPSYGQFKNFEERGDLFIKLMSA